MKALIIVLTILASGCRASGAEAPVNFSAAYLDVAAMYNTAVDTWDGIDREAVPQMVAFARRMATATRCVETALVATDWPEEVQEAVDELLEAEAKAHVAFLIMAESQTKEEANERLVEAFTIYTTASEYSEVVRVRLGLPSVSISPHHYL